MEKYYDIYFDPAELEVDEKGHLLNFEEAVHIVEFDENGNVCSVTNNAGDVNEVLEMFHLGEGDDTLAEAKERFYDWLENHTEWRETLPQTYWQPAEYICIGITDYVDEPPIYHRYSNSWY